jgi:dTDP-glucose 4,6-dehydratase
MQIVLITLAAGIFGSNFISYYLENNKGFNIVALDLLTYTGDLSNLQVVENQI